MDYVHLLSPNAMLQLPVCWQSLLLQLFLPSQTHQILVPCHPFCVIYVVKMILANAHSDEQILIVQSVAAWSSGAAVNRFLFVCLLNLWICHAPTWFRNFQRLLAKCPCILLNHFLGMEFLRVFQNKWDFQFSLHRWGRFDRPLDDTWDSLTFFNEMRSVCSFGIVVSLFQKISVWDLYQFSEKRLCIVRISNM